MRIVTGLLGPYGEGKSTTIRMVIGLIRSSSGSASVMVTSIEPPPSIRSRRAVRTSAHWRYSKGSPEHASTGCSRLASAAGPTAADGTVAALATVLDVVGIVALALAASSVARDLELGTIRNLLAVQPRRGILLSGKLLAQGSFLVIGFVVAGMVSVALAYALAPGQETSTDLWTLGVTLETAVLVVIVTLLYGLLGATLGIVTRSAAISITIGAGYLLIAERLISPIWDTSGEWLPAGILAAFAAGGTQAV